MMAGQTTFGDLHLPFDGEILSPAVVRFREPVIFVHHFGGSKKTLGRHVRFVNDLGFRAVVFNLLYHDARTPLHALPITASLKFGARFIWAEQIESILNSVPGRKIVFSLSMPSNSALMALANRQGEDIAGAVCEGGPFLQLSRCIWNLYTHEYQLDSKLLRGAFTAASLALMGVGIDRDVAKIFRELPKGFPLLQVHGAADPLVPKEAIDDFLAPAQGLELERLEVPAAGHLDSLKIAPELYDRVVGGFLRKIAVAL